MMKVKEKLKKFRKSRLISITCIQNENFELYYHFDDNGIKCVKIKMKQKEKIESVSDWYPQAEFFERETHDFFGIEFVGNPRLHEKLYLAENWRRKPPHLK